MQRRHHQVAREARLDRDLCRLQVANFPDHDDIGILSQNRPQAPGERHVRPFVDLRLPYSGQVVFDWILYRKDVHGPRAELGQRGVEGRCLAGAGRAGHEKDAVGPMDHFAQQFERVGAHAEVWQGQSSSLLVQDSEDDPFAVCGRQRRDPHIHFAATDTQCDSAILGHALLGDIEFRHDLDAGNQERREGAFGPHDFAHDAIDPKANGEIPLERLDVHVRRILADRLRQQRVDQADDRGVVLLFQQVADLRHGFRQARQVHVLAQVFDHLFRLGGVPGVDLPEQAFKFTVRDGAQGEATPGKPPNLGQGRQRRRIPANEGHAPIGGTIGNGNAESPRECERQAPRRRAGEFERFLHLFTRSSRNGDRMITPLDDNRLIYRVNTRRRHVRR